MISNSANDMVGEHAPRSSSVPQRGPSIIHASLDFQSSAMFHRLSEVQGTTRKTVSLVSAGNL
jgi:hypothetical protein